MKPLKLARHVHNRSLCTLCLAVFSSAFASSDGAGMQPTDQQHHTTVSIAGDEFHINGKPTYEGREWNGCKIEGLLMNSRVVQGIFDDLNPETQSRWAYPDTREWSADRNTREFIEAMPSWREHGLLAFTINLQGGSPEGYSAHQPWHNSAFELGMVVILGYFYFGQDQRLHDVEAVKNAVRNATEWVLDGGWENVIIELNNECNLSAYDHEILRAGNVHELIEMVRKMNRNGRRLLAGASFSGGKLPEAKVVAASDFILIHGNGVNNPERIASMVRKSRKIAIEQHGHPIPILFNEDDHYDFDKVRNNFTAAGYFDYRFKDEVFDEGYQSVPVNWSISSQRKRGFFKLLAQITGAK